MSLNKFILQDPKDLLKALAFDPVSIWIECGSGGVLEHEFDLNPSDFLSFADADLAESNQRALVNALSNAKRAIDCQVDKVFCCFGTNSRKNFPQKMKILNEMGIIAPRIISKIVTMRNYLEHEYRCPEQEKVEDAVDIANLFVTSLDRALQFPDQYAIENSNEAEDERSLDVRFDEENKEFHLYGRTPNMESRSVIKASALGYIPLIRLSICVERQLNCEAAAQNFFSVFV